MSSSDEWDTTSDDEMASMGPPLQKSTVEAIKIPLLTRSDRERIPETVEFQNLTVQGQSKYVFRCEPADKKYPGVVVPEHMRTCDAVLISLYVHNSKSDHHMTRVPDFKTKNLNVVRREGGVVFVKNLRLLSNWTLNFKKKNKDRVTNKDTAFELGKKFLSYTGDASPRFTFILVPFSNGRLMIAEAARTCKFQIESKRQDQNRRRPKKRLRKNTELLQTETNIREANVTLGSLRQELRRVRLRNTQNVEICHNLKLHCSELSVGPLKLAIEFATRNLGTEGSGSVSL